MSPFRKSWLCFGWGGGVKNPLQYKTAGYKIKVVQLTDVYTNPIQDGNLSKLEHRSTSTGRPFWIGFSWRTLVYAIVILLSIR